MKTRRLVNGVSQIGCKYPVDSKRCIEAFSFLALAPFCITLLEWASP